jgi:hypothetical protein
MEVKFFSPDKFTSIKCGDCIAWHFHTHASMKKGSPLRDFVRKTFSRPFNKFISGLLFILNINVYNAVSQQQQQ